ncbi:galactose-1-phosphate uridylyltransferase [[Pasteurella] aerogenes]
MFQVGKAQLHESGQKDQWVQILENKGAAMGCSNPHPHGQIWANSFLTNEVQREDEAQRKSWQQHGSGLLVEYVQRELTQQERIGVRTEDWVAVVA